ncbi:MAG TPA: exodeoxyribonuclease VII large subunit [Verrucomicrobiales bacterium]|nr:exodeoxyribonuclease VII large subunit [Verrucomicrobiales bacterium]
MATKPSSTPQFGELFSNADLRQVLTVAQLTTRVKRLLEGQLGRVWVTGEVTNLRAQASGHLYFTLKDAAAQLSCVLFRGEAAAARQHVQDGQKLLLGGDVTVYEPRGQYQLRVMTVELQGVGALQLAFEQLKRRLQAEGLFASERKRPMPRFPRRIGVVTSPTGAALRDVLHVIERRHPGLEILLAPCRVQGQGAAEEIANAIRDLNRVHESGLARLDLILATRGGGSLEDLWAFNEEVVARAIHASGLPVVSAVGHEIDFTISDLVADLRAATPTAAAELITEGAFSSRQYVATALERIGRLAARQLSVSTDRLDQGLQRLARVAPRRWVLEQAQYVDDLQQSMIRAARGELRIRQGVWQGLGGRLALLKPSRWLATQGTAVRELSRRLGAVMPADLARRQALLQGLTDRVRLLSPLSILERGYSITRDAASGRVLKSATGLAPGQRLITRLQDGEVESHVAPTPGS